MKQQFSHQLQRKPKQRSIPIDLIVCEGETEIDYLGEIAKWKRIHVDIKKSKGSDPLSIVKTAKKYSRDYDRTYCVFDKDSHDKNFFDAIEFCRESGFYPIISNPCIELWFLKHYHFRSSALGGPKETVKALRQYFPKYEKDGVIAFYETYHLIETACKNARRLESRVQDHSHIDPYTNVDQLAVRFDEILAIKSE